MKNAAKLFAIALVSFSCGTSGSSEKQADEAPVKEEEIVESVTSEISKSQEELKETTEENLDEIDSLLQNLD